MKEFVVDFITFLIAVFVFLTGVAIVISPVVISMITEESLWLCLYLPIYGFIYALLKK